MDLLLQINSLNLGSPNTIGSRDTVVDHMYL